MTKTEQSKLKQPSAASPVMVALDVFMMRASTEEVAEAADAFANYGHVYLQSPCAAMVAQDGDEPAATTAHHLRMHVPQDEAMAALDAMHAYRKLVIPEAYIVAEIATVIIALF